MSRFKEILNDVQQYAIEAAEKFGGKKRSELKDSDFLFPETRSFPIVTPADVPDAISNFGRMKGQMSYDAFLRKLYNMAKRKGPAFVAALPKATKDKLGIKTKAECDPDDSPEECEKEKLEDKLELEMLKKKLEQTKSQDDMEMEEEMEEYKNSYYGMSVGSLKAIASHAMDILNNLDNETVKENLTAAHLQGMIAVAEDHLRSIHDFVMFVEENDDNEEETESAVTTVEPQKKKKKRVRIKDLPAYQFYPIPDPQNEGKPTPPNDFSISEKKPGLWDNIRKKKEKEGKNYRPARPGEKDRPDPEQWKKLTK